MKGRANLLLFNASVLFKFEQDKINSYFLYIFRLVESSKFMFKRIVFIIQKKPLVSLCNIISFVIMCNVTFAPSD